MTRKLLKAAALLLCACPAAAQQAAAPAPKPAPPALTDVWRQVKIGDIEVYSPVTGVTTAQDTFDVFAPFDGRVEEVQVELFNLAGPETVLARMVSTEMAALLDSTPEEGRKQTERRWSDLYKFHDIKPEFKGVVTNVFVEPRTPVFKGDRLFTIARKVVMIGRNTKPLYSDIANDMIAGIRHYRTGEKFDTKLVNFLRIKDRPLFYRLWLEVTDLKEGIRIGEQFDGDLFVGRSNGTRLVPRNHIFETGGRKYLMMEVESGLITEEETEILRPGSTYLELKRPPDAAPAPKDAAEEPEAAPAAPPAPQKSRLSRKAKEGKNAGTGKTR